MKRYRRFKMNILKMLIFLCKIFKLVSLLVLFVVPFCSESHKNLYKYIQFKVRFTVLSTYKLQKMWCKK